VMFVQREPDCALRSIHGANIGQDFNVEVNLLVPADPTGAVTDFRNVMVSLGLEIPELRQAKTALPRYGD
jgi:hypothetical protein